MNTTTPDTAALVGLMLAAREHNVTLYHRAYQNTLGQAACLRANRLDAFRALCRAFDCQAATLQARDRDLAPHREAWLAHPAIPPEALDRHLELVMQEANLLALIGAQQRANTVLLADISGGLRLGTNPSPRKESPIAHAPSTATTGS